MSNFHDPLILTLSLPLSKEQTTLRLQVNISKGLFFHPDIRNVLFFVNRGLSLLSTRMSEFDPHSCVEIEFYTVRNSSALLTVFHFMSLKS